MSAPRVVCFATQGSGSVDERRLLDLLGEVHPEPFAFDRRAKVTSAGRLLVSVRRRRPDVLVMEGTGMAGGAAVVLARVLLRVPFIVASGDAVGPYLGLRRRVATLPGWLYEVILCRLAAGYIGWTPYLAGRALTLGAPRAMTAAHFAPFPDIVLSREEVRRRLGVPGDALVVGIAGTARWNERRGYCYGWELVSAIRRVRRPDVAVVVLGDGTGIEHLRALAGDELGRRVFIPGPIAPELVVSYLAALDIGSLPQSVDQVGAFRYTAKLPEYVAARLPPVTSRTPAAYDLMDGWSWRLAGGAPWSACYVDALAAFLEHVRPDEIAARRAAMPTVDALLSPAGQRRRVSAFVREIVDSRQRRATSA